jgi:hypothetical protein
MGPNKAPVYALEGSIAVAGACISWLANHLGLKANEAETRENRSWLRAKEAETLGEFRDQADNECILIIRDFPCQTLKIRNVSLVVMGS